MRLSSVWDARAYTPRQLVAQIPEFLRELLVEEASHLDPMPWLRAILLVSPQPSDELALSVMSEGVMVLEAARERLAIEVVEQFLQHAGQFQAMDTRRSHVPSATESEFSREPAYFNQELYSEWIEKLSQPWRSEDAFGPES